MKKWLHIAWMTCVHSVDPNYNQHMLHRCSGAHLWPYQRQISPFMELYMTKGKSLEFINAPRNVIGLHSAFEEEPGRGEEHLLSCTWSGEDQRTAHSSDRKLLNQHFLFHLRPERNPFGWGQERKGERKKKERDGGWIWREGRRWRRRDKGRRGGGGGSRQDGGE